MKIHLFLILFTTIKSLTATTQTLDFKQNDLYIEAGGNGLFGSVNYERQLTRRPGPGIRLGVGFYSDHAFYLTLPVAVNYLFPLKNPSTFIDAAVGVTLTRIDGKLFGKSDNPIGDHFVNFIPSLGYRKHTYNNVMWRISITPVINKNGLVPWLGASIGKRF